MGKNVFGGLVFLGSLVGAMSLTGNVSMFLDLPSALLVIVGTAGLTFLGNRPGESWSEISRRASEICWKVGLLGLVIGLIGILANLANPQLIGPYAAISLLSLLYGIMASLLLKGMADSAREPTRI